MKKILNIRFVLPLAAFGVFAFADSQTSVTGKVTPADAVESVWAIAGADSLKAELSNGSFAVSVKPGTYKIMVDAKEPLKDVLLENVEVKHDEVVNLGEIKLVK